MTVPFLDSVRPMTPQHRPRRLPDDQYIPHHRPVLHVRKIQPHSLIPGQVRSPAHLPQSLHSWFHQQSAPLFAVVLFHFTTHRRPRTHHTHFTPQHVDELGYLVDA